MLKNVLRTESAPILFYPPNSPRNWDPTSTKDNIQRISDENFRLIKHYLADAPATTTLSESVQENSDKRVFERVLRISKPKGKGQNYAERYQSDSSTEAKFALIKGILETELTKTASLHFLEDPKRRVDVQLDAIDLIPDELCVRQGSSRDALRLAIAKNTRLSPKNRCQAMYRLEADDSQIEVLKVFNQDDSLFEALLFDIKVKKLQLQGLCSSLISTKQQKKLSKNLLHFYFLNKDPGTHRSLDDLLKLAFILDRTQTEVYPGHTIAVSNSDAALINLALNPSFSLNDRFRALRPILSVEAKLHIPELKALLHTHASKSTISSNHKLSKCELISPREFSSDLALLLLPNSQDVMDLYKLIQSYYGIPRKVQDHLHNRTELLNKAIDDIQRILEDLSESQDPALSSLQAYQMRTLRNIQSQAQQKIYYLKKLPGLKQKALDRVSLSAKPKYALPPNIPVLNVVLDVFRNLDPLNRKDLDSHIKLWRNMVINQDSEPLDFWLWLDKVDTGALRDNRYSLWNKEQKRVQFQEGLAYNAVFGNKNDNNRLDRDYNYNIGQDGQLYILPDEHEGIDLTHDTILKGKNILAAGCVNFEQGKLVYIDVASGHYAPDRFKNLQPALAYFLKKNPGAIHSDTQIGNYKEDHPIYLYEAFKDMKSPEGEEERKTIKLSLKQLGFEFGESSSLT